MRIIKLVWYFWFWTYVRIALSFYFRKIKISGKEHIPKGVPVIFGANHENALIDPLIMTTRFPMMIHYLVRADVFNNALIRKFLNSLNLMPVYRIRDGVNSVKANELIFKNCFKAFSKKEHLILFPEASHDERRQRKIAKKGIARIALGAMHEPNAPDELYIVPVGLNYSRHKAFRSTVHIVYGEPIKIQKIEQSNENIESLRKEYEEALAKCCVSFPREKFEVLDKTLLHDLSANIPLNPKELNEAGEKVILALDAQKEEEILATAKKLNEGGMRFPFEKKSLYFIHLFTAFILSPVAILGMIIHAPGLVVSWYIMKGIKDKVYIDTIYFGVGMVFMPITWLFFVLWIPALGFNILMTIGLIAFVPITLLAFGSMIKHWQLFRSNQQLASSQALRSEYSGFLNLIQSIKG